MINFIGIMAVALLRQGLGSRLMLLALRPMGQSFARLRIANAVAYLASVAAGVYGFPLGGPRRLIAQLALNLAPALVWLTWDTLVLMRRRAKIRDAVYISRMR